VVFVDQSSHTHSQSTGATPDHSTQRRGKRTARVAIRFTPDELEQVRMKAHHAGRSLARWLRELSLGYTPKPKPSAANAEVIRHLARIGNNVNQLAHLANSRDKLPELNILTAIRDAVLTQIDQIG
jgi:Bacterial mobilisation protein (MobC)